MAILVYFLTNYFIFFLFSSFFLICSLIFFTFFFDDFTFNIFILNFNIEVSEKNDGSKRVYKKEFSLYN